MIRRPSTAFLRHISARIIVDRAVIYGMLGTAQVFLTGPVTALIIAFSLTTEVQGYYYTFAALLALQVLVELGFAQVIMQFASHEWAHLRLRDDRSIDGDAAALSRLTSLARLATKWYWRFSVLLGTGLAVAGILFFNDAGSADVGWKGPWVAIAVLTAVDFMMLPLWSLLQGANQMAAVNFARLVSGLLLVVMLWGGLSLGAGLWSVAAAKAVSLSWDIGYLVRYRRFFGSLLRKRTGPAINWRSEILPVQWRTAVTYMSSYFVFSLFVPVIFRYEGPAEAGRWGMTWGLVMAGLGAVDELVGHAGARVRGADRAAAICRAGRRLAQGDGRRHRPVPPDERRRRERDRGHPRDRSRARQPAAAVLHRGMPVRRHRPHADLGRSIDLSARAQGRSRCLPCRSSPASASPA